MHVLAGPVASKLVHYAISGTIGVAVVKAAQRVAPTLGPVAREWAVAAAARGIVVGRTLNGLAEEARLKAGDLIAEAHESLGEQAPAPSSTDTSAHEH
ncbi:DUF1490 family protein [Saccharopolyspora taberi]|uniref:DUF1490 family protein n=1 Tax=Saccharopolyspora taberi TaxID=60895 RepID=A0ABN3VBN2_9PSEU